MQLTVNTKTLAQAVSTCCRVAKRNNIKPILENIRVTAEGERITLFATDLERSIELEVPATIDKPGKCLIGANALRAALSNEASPEVCIESTDRHVILRADRSQVKWGLCKDDMPTPPEFKENGEFTIPAMVLAAALRSTVPFVDEGSGRFALGGVLIEQGPSGTYFVATDCKSLAAYGPAGESADERTAIIPAASVQLIISALKGEGDCDVRLSNSEVVFCTDSAKIYSRQLEGAFPKWKTLFDFKPKINVSLATAEFSSVVSKCLIVRQEADAKNTIEHQVHTSFAFKDGKLTATSETDIGEANAEAIISQCDPIEVGLDCSLVSRVLRSMNDHENTDISMTDAESAVLFSQNLLRCVVMPLAK